MCQVASHDARGSNLGKPQKSFAHSLALPHPLRPTHIGSCPFCLLAPQRLLFFSLGQKYLCGLINKAVECAPLWPWPFQPYEAHMGVRRKVKLHEHEVRGQRNVLGVDGDASTGLNERQHAC